MNTIKYPRITFNSVPVHSKHRKARIAAAWKEVIADEMAIRTTSTYYCKQDYPALVILRNILLNRSEYIGFTPKLKLRQLKSGGTSFCNAYAEAYFHLYYNIRDQRAERFINGAISKLLRSADETFFSFQERVNFIPARDMCCAEYCDNFAARSNKFLIQCLENGTKTRKDFNSYEDVLDNFDTGEPFNIIERAVFDDQQPHHAQLQKSIEEFARGWLSLKNIKDRCIHVKLVAKPIPYSYYTPVHIYRKPSYINILIATVNSEGKIKEHYVPAEQLWEVNWLKENGNDDT